MALGDSDFLVTYLEPQEVAENRKALESLLAPAFDHADRELTVEDAFHLVDREIFILWIVVNKETNAVVAAAMTEVIDFPRRSVVRIIALGGKSMVQWIDDFIATIQEYASFCGADAIDCCVRKGLTRLLAKKGFYVPYTTMRLSAPHEQNKTLH
jgi:hypothetical protein